MNEDNKKLEEPKIFETKEKGLHMGEPRNVPLMDRISFSAKILYLVIIIFNIIGLLIWFGWSGYAPDWVGLGKSGNSNNPKTLWDLLDLILIPTFFVIIAYWFNKSQKENDALLEEGRISNNVLQNYLDQMGEILKDGSIYRLEKDSAIRKVIKSKTLITLDRVQSFQRKLILRFLSEATLLNKDNPVIELEDANFDEVFFITNPVRANYANLKELKVTRSSFINSRWVSVDFSNSDLSNNDFSDSDFVLVNFNNVNLSGSSFIGAELGMVSFYKADLRGVRFRELGEKPSKKRDTVITVTNFDEVIYNDQTIWPEGFHPEEFNAIHSDQKIDDFMSLPFISND